MTVSGQETCILKVACSCTCCCSLSLYLLWSTIALLTFRHDLMSAEFHDVIHEATEEVGCDQDLGKVGKPLVFAKCPATSVHDFHEDLKKNPLVNLLSKEQSSSFSGMQVSMRAEVYLWVANLMNNISSASNSMPNSTVHKKYALEKQWVSLERLTGYAWNDQRAIAPLGTACGICEKEDCSGIVDPSGATLECAWPEEGYAGFKKEQDAVDVDGLLRLSEGMTKHAWAHHQRHDEHHHWLDYDHRSSFTALAPEGSVVMGKNYVLNKEQLQGDTISDNSVPLELTKSNSLPQLLEGKKTYTREGVQFPILLAAKPNETEPTVGDVRLNFNMSNLARDGANFVVLAGVKPTDGGFVFERKTVRTRWKAADLFALYRESDAGDIDDVLELQYVSPGYTHKLQHYNWDHYIVRLFGGAVLALFGILFSSMMGAWLISPIGAAPTIWFYFAIMSSFYQPEDSDSWEAFGTYCAPLFLLLIPFGITVWMRCSGVVVSPSFILVGVLLAVVLPWNVIGIGMTIWRTALLFHGVAIAVVSGLTTVGLLMLLRNVAGFEYSEAAKLKALGESDQGYGATQP